MKPPTLLVEPPVTVLLRMWQSEIVVTTATCATTPPTELELDTEEFFTVTPVSEQAYRLPLVPT